MLRITISQINKIFFRNNSLFSSSQPEIKSQKSYRMPQRPIAKLFKPKKPVQFHQGRALIYLNKQGLLTPTLLTTHLTIPMIYLGYLIKNNPFYLTFPAALPIMGFMQIFLFIRFITHKKDNKYQIQRIYLTQSGELVQVWLANKIRRKLKNTPDTMYFLIKDLTPPPEGQNQLPRKGTQFPQSFNSIRMPAPWEYGWMKYDINRENYIIPKKYQYTNWELLVPVMKGINIDTSQCPKTPIPIDEQRTLPTVEDAVKEAENLIKEEIQWEKKYGKILYKPEEDI